MAAPPLLSVLRYSAFGAGVIYGSVRLMYLSGKDAKYQAALKAKHDAQPHH